MKKLLSVYVRSLIFGVEDSLVSTVGLLSGIAAAGTERSALLLTGVVLLAVEGFSMAAGSFLSERTVEEYTGHGDTPLYVPIMAGVIIFAAYVIAGLIPLAPYAYVPANSAALIWSVAVSMTALFFLGAMSARHFDTHWIARGVRMLVIGGFAIALGVFIGQLLPGTTL